MYAEKPLGGASRLEPLHLALSPPHRLMRVFGAIIHPQPLLMRAGQSQTPERRGVRGQLIGDQQFGYKPLLSEKLAHQPQCRPAVAALWTSMSRTSPSWSTARHRYIRLPGIVPVWGGFGWSWHPVPGHWSRWRGAWAPPHCAPNHLGGWRGACGGTGLPHLGLGRLRGGWQGPLEAGATTAAVGAIRSYSLRRSESWISFVPRSARDFCRHFFASSNRLAKMLFEPGRSGLREQLTGSRGGSVIIVGGSSSDRPQSANLLPSPASIAVDLAPDQ